MNLKTRTKTTNEPRGGKIVTLLLRFGVDIPKGRKQQFWSVNSGQLDYIFQDAHRGYIEAIKKAHPDNGGSEREAQAVNRDWAQIKRRFRILCPRALE